MRAEGRRRWWPAGGRGRRRFASAGTGLVIVGLVGLVALVGLVDLVGLAVAGRRASASATDAAVVDGAGSQTVDGFGVSGAWWPGQIAQFPAPVQRQVSDLLFTAQGLDVSQYRYNIGAGGVGVSVPWKAPATFLTATGAYDWSRDPAGVSFLRAAARDGVGQLIGFANSAPAAFTTDAKSCGGSLAPASVASYASYLATVVDHFWAADHVRLADVSPMNEPDGSQWTCHQEGMVVPVPERAPLIEDLASDLRADGVATGVIADESNMVRKLLEQAPGWLPQTEAAGAIAAVAHHTYDYPTPAELAPVSRLRAKTWATEVCCYNGVKFGWGYDPTMTSGLWLADTIWADLTAAHDSAFDWWTALSRNIGCSPGASPGCQDQAQPLGRNDALIYFDPRYATDHDYALYPTKRFAVLAQFSRYIRPGARLHEVTGAPAGTRAVAFERKSSWQVVLVDDVATGARVDVRLPRTGLAVSRAVTTDDAVDLAPGSASLSGRNLTVDLPARSVTTVLLRQGASAGGHSGRPPAVTARV